MQVDFYQLSRDPVEDVLPAVAQRVMDDGGRLLVVDRRDGALDRLSRALWSWRPDAFLAHGMASGDDPAVQPILLSTRCEPVDNGARHVAITDGEWNEAALGFDRAFYFFDDRTIEGARACWRGLRGKEEVVARFWRQDGRKWVQGP